MKLPILTAAICLGVSHFAFADLKIPNSIFKMEEIEEAKAKAFEEKEPLIFVYTDPGTS